MAAAPGRGVTASVIFLHGSGDTGQGLQAWVKSLLQKDLASPHIRVSYPTAPFQPYTANNGEKRHVWYDRYKISWDVPEHEASIDAACRSLDEVIEKVVQSGISKNRIVIGGFSMGGAMAMLLTYRFHRDVAGVFALSSFLNKGSSVYTALREAQGESFPELLQCHGRRDDLVPYAWGQGTAQELRALGVKVQQHDFPRLTHDMSAVELALVQDWILAKLPPTDG
ncbi:lysophospholipase-like protein 1 isoform X1 [Petromyzon marinus]|uniref:lysophospholipase-like protein 1 isoform X1 n=1 Tax=Petromyzon marinus TaxID=7757 RepID=UPI003F70CF63